MASRLVSANHDLSKRMVFHTADIMNVTHKLKDYDVIFLKALVGMNIADKNKVIQYLAKYMAPGAILMLRCAHGACAFLYLVVDPNVLHGFSVLLIFHPNDDVINSVVISPYSLLLWNTISKLPLYKKIPSSGSLITMPAFPTTPSGRVRGKLIQKLLLNQKCMGYLVRTYYSISPTRYYKDDSWLSADLKSNEKQIQENFDMTKSAGK
uniref:Nicotianamine synthase n=1 Tax=Tanacetum cinerariifolium TaxID=118510 RepID=A0A699H027_TANCI|nr:nicotianamine synthase, S-adenosyl-L-methionine-dependent methyltransferase [Tanacetum cinerariifolium]